jgi:hypothetical protein
MVVRKTSHCNQRDKRYSRDYCGDSADSGRPGHGASGHDGAPRSL